MHILIPPVQIQIRDYSNTTAHILCTIKIEPKITTTANVIAIKTACIVDSHITIKIRSDELDFAPKISNGTELQTKISRRGQ